MQHIGSIKWLTFTFLKKTDHRRQTTHLKIRGYDFHYPITWVGTESGPSNIIELMAEIVEYLQVPYDFCDCTGQKRSGKAKTSFHVDRRVRKYMFGCGGSDAGKARRQLLTPTPPFLQASRPDPVSLLISAPPLCPSPTSPAKSKSTPFLSGSQHEPRAALPPSSLDPGSPNNLCLLCRPLAS